MKFLYFIAFILFLVTGILRVTSDTSPIFYTSSFILATFYLILGISAHKKSKASLES